MATQRRPDRERMETPLNPHEEHWTVSGPIRPVAPEEHIQELELNAHATVADASPLGLAAFAVTTFTLGSVLAGWQGIASPGATPTATGFVATVPLLIVFGGIAQFIAAMWAFRKGSTFWATFLGVFGALYGTLGLSAILAGTGVVPTNVATPDVPTGVGIGLFAFVAAYLTWAAMGESMVMTWVGVFLTASLALMSAAFFLSSGVNGWIFWASGYSAIASALIAFYASAAIVINSTMQREVLPY